MKGHFPGFPMLPGVLAIESMAQAAAILGKLTFPNLVAEDYRLLTLHNAQFLGPIIPDATMEIYVKVLKRDGLIYTFEGTCGTNSSIAVIGEFSAKLPSI